MQTSLDICKSNGLMDTKSNFIHGSFDIISTFPTLMSSLQARAVLLDTGLRAELFPAPTGTVRTGTGLKASPSRDAALTLGGVRDAAAQPIATPPRVQP